MTVVFTELDWAASSAPLGRRVQCCALTHCRAAACPLPCNARGQVRTEVLGAAAALDNNEERWTVDKVGGRGSSCGEQAAGRNGCRQGATAAVRARCRRCASRLPASPPPCLSTSLPACLPSPACLFASQVVQMAKEGVDVPKMLEEPQRRLLLRRELDKKLNDGKGARVMTGVMTVRSWCLKLERQSRQAALSLMPNHAAAHSRVAQAPASAVQVHLPATHAPHGRPPHPLHTAAATRHTPCATRPAPCARAAGAFDASFLLGELPGILGVEERRVRMLLKELVGTRK